MREPGVKEKGAAKTVRMSFVPRDALRKPDWIRVRAPAADSRFHDVKRILRLLPAKRQNLLFSATFADEIRSLADSLLHEPAEIEVARRSAPAEIVEQRIYLVLPVGTLNSK